MSTWGHLRLVLATAYPGVSLDLVDSYLNECYTSVLEASDWTGLHAHATIQTTAAYQSATSESVTLTVGSATVTGVGTAWTGAIVGRQFFRPGDNVVYTVASVTSVTALTLDRPYEGVSSDPAGAVYSASPYTLMTDIYALPLDARSPVTVINPVNGLPMQEMSKQELDQSAGTRATVGDPYAFAVYDDSPEATPPVVHQIQFYPAPLRSRGYELDYLRNANYFTGENTSDSPLPFVSDGVLLDCARSKLSLYLGEMAKSAGYATAAQTELNRLLMLEHSQTRASSSLRMAVRFTRHRLGRVDRTWGRNWGASQGGPN